MTPLAAIPLNSLTWFVGSLTCFTLCYRSYVSYRHSTNELSKYLTYFALSMGFGQLFLAIPPLITLNTHDLRMTYLAGELFIYLSAIPQASIVWCLMLRSKISLKVVTFPVLIVGLMSWLYAIPRSSLYLQNNFITYKDPLASTLVIGIILIGLFLPVGFYFLRGTAQQKNLRGTLISMVLGFVYIGIGLSTGGVELITGEVITRSSAIGDLAFFCVLLIVLIWPRHIKIPKISS